MHSRTFDERRPCRTSSLAQESTPPTNRMRTSMAEPPVELEEALSEPTPTGGAALAPCDLEGPAVEKQQRVAFSHALRLRLEADARAMDERVRRRGPRPLGGSPLVIHQMTTPPAPQPLNPEVVSPRMVTMSLPDKAGLTEEAAAVKNAAYAQALRLRLVAEDRAMDERAENRGPRPVDASPLISPRTEHKTKESSPPRRLKSIDGASQWTTVAVPGKPRPPLPPLNPMCPDISPRLELRTPAPRPYRICAFSQTLSEPKSNRALIVTSAALGPASLPAFPLPVKPVIVLRPIMSARAPNRTPVRVRRQPESARGRERERLSPRRELSGAPCASPRKAHLRGSSRELVVVNAYAPAAAPAQAPAATLPPLGNVMSVRP